MKCKNCGCNSLIPIVSGVAGEQGFRAEMLGILRFGGVLIGNSPKWYCINCRAETCSDESQQEHADAVSNALAIASDAKVEWLEYANAKEIAMGRQVFERLVSDFTSVGATSVKLSGTGEAFARFEGDYEPMEWSLAVHCDNVLQALRAGACDTSMRKVSIAGSTVEITL